MGRNDGGFGSRISCIRCGRLAPLLPDSLGRMHCPFCHHMWVPGQQKIASLTDQIGAPPRTEDLLDDEEQRSRCVSTALPPPQRIPKIATVLERGDTPSVQFPERHPPSRRKKTGDTSWLGLEDSSKQQSSQGSEESPTQRRVRGVANPRQVQDLVRGDPMEGMRLGGCRIERLLGEGGMGKVYLARQLKLDRKVAIKVLPHALHNDQEFLQVFEHEARTLASLNHPNILQIFDFGIDPVSERSFMVMEYVHGQDLHELIVSRHHLDSMTAMVLIRQAALGLHAANRKNIIHRDVKPKNLLVSKDGTCKVTDFGLALAMHHQHSADEIRMGTAAFMSPEQSAGAPLDTRSDMYALGCTAFMALTGRPPYDGDSPHDIVLQHRTKPVMSLKGLVQDYDLELDQVLMRTMAKHPQDRFPSMARLIEAIDKIIANSKRVPPPKPATADRPAGSDAATKGETKSWLFE